LATSYSLSVTFSGTAADVNGSVNSYGFGGAFAGVFEDAGVPSLGFFQLTVAPQSVSFDNPTIGNTTFDAANTGIDLFFQDGVLWTFAFGGYMNQFSGLTPNTDDFAIYIDPSGLTSSTLLYATTAAPNDFGVDSAPFVQFSLTEVQAVPEGTATFTYLVGVFAMSLYGRRRLKAATSGRH
jgi:hypothetical protein